MNRSVGTDEVTHEQYADPTVSTLSTVMSAGERTRLATTVLPNPPVHPVDRLVPWSRR